VEKLTLILGGARSGKSTYAEKLALRSGGRIAYIATAQALDHEMEQRIANHQSNRPGDWETRELPIMVGEALLADPPLSDVVLVDCLTLLVSNILMQVNGSESEVNEVKAIQLVKQEVDNLIKAIQKIPAEWIVVSNEVGLGLVPPYPLGRIYRDLLGWSNQRLASQAKTVTFMIAGIPMRLSPAEE
jgi:adenosylcobinamide kinase / adenosylcobinamide-phosphate guanylyltransferase